MSTRGAVPASARLGSYMRKLREGYGYTLRKVEERSQMLGDPIDNSQLSRFEKGKAYPSFDKLRTLSKIFNVSVQNFADMVELEQYDLHRPDTEQFEELMEFGADAIQHGEHGRAFVCFEAALEQAESDLTAEGAQELAARARTRMAVALRKLGKLSLAEGELRYALKHRKGVEQKTQVRMLLHFAYVLREQGDYFLTEVVARECVQLAEREDDTDSLAGAISTLANVYFDSGECDKAIPHYERVLSILEERSEGDDAIRLLTQATLGDCYLRSSNIVGGLKHLKHALQEARRHGFKRITAYCLTKLGSAYLERDKQAQGLQALRESDRIASGAEDGQKYVDILFLNAFLQWEQARRERKATREKIAFGRLRHLRAQLERSFPEVETFDAYVAGRRGGRNRAKS